MNGNMRCQSIDPFDQTFIDRMAQGVVILERPTKPCRIERLRSRTVSHHPHRRTQSTDPAYVSSLGVSGDSRCIVFRIMHITITGLVEGEWKDLTEEEQSSLLRAVGRPVN